MQGSLEQASSLQQSSGRRGRLWNNQNCLRRSSLFSLYAKIFRLLLGKWEPATLDETSEEDAYLRELDRLVLPSNEEWRLRVYYRLVELQRSGDSAASDDQQISMIEEQRQQTTTARGGVKVADWSPKESNVKWDWEPDERSIYPLTARSSRRLSSLASNASVILDCQIEPGWRLNDILLAARLLSGEQSRLNFTDEAEMRRVYGLVYDVLRYEFILNQALDEVGFWVRNSTLKKLEKVVWLLLYDMQGRKFSRPGSSAALAARNDALKQAGLWDVEKALLDMKTKLAASLSRLRIGGSALSLDELLPPHLRTAEGVTWGEEGSIASGWVNSVRLPSRKEFVDAMRRLGLRQRTVRPSGCCDLDEDQYAFDPLCPKVVNLHERARERLAVSQLVRGHCFVFLERSLCIGAAAMVQAIRAGKLCGPVVLTHPLAPRHTGYLAELLADVDEAGRLLVFGLGNERARHVEYLETLGISLSRCKLFTEKYTNAPSSPEIERATIVLATPPCSYTGVRDVVDLAIARGGDLRLLESLTSLESESPQQPRQLLAEQMATLRHALTKPNVQLLVYEVHTLLPSETNEMIEQAVDYANNLAIDKYRREHPHPKRKSKDGKKGKRKKSVSSEQSTSRTSETYGDKDEETIKVPDSDLFEMTNLSDIYNQDCQGMIDPGSFIVVVKRKEMMQFNSLFMIKVAEAKGVFGESKPPPTKSAEEPEEQAMVPVSMERTISRRSPRRNKPHIERLTVPTYATIVRVLQERRICTRHQQHLEHEASALEAQKPPDSEPINNPLSPVVIPHNDACSGLSNDPDRSEKSDNDDDTEDKEDREWNKKADIIKSALQLKFPNVPALNLKNLQKTVKKEYSRPSHYPTARYANGDSPFGKSTSQIKLTPRTSTQNINNQTEKLKLNLFSTMDPFHDFVKKKNREGVFDITFKPINLNSRRHYIQNRGKRLNRIPFHTRLETVYEHSPNFAYLFPEN